MQNQFSRTELLIGAKALEKLAQSKVAVFGIGGVGSYAVEGLVRAGVGRFILIDHDCIYLTNLNRQMHALMSTLGQPKVEVMKNRILEINPRAEVETYPMFYTHENAAELIKPDYDYIIDAIDTVTAKIDLILTAQQMNIPIISSMGAGNKLDPTRFEIADIYDTSVCPLAKVLRRELRKRGVDKLKVVYSREEPRKPLEMVEDGCAGTCTARRQTPGSISFVPSVAGLIIAGEVVKDLIRPLE